MKWRVTEKLEWRHWATPRRLRTVPVHRWLLFPHSFAGELVCELIREWNLDGHDRILDPFVGSGTTPVAAKEVGIPCVGFDLSPLAVLATSTKLTDFKGEAMRKRGRELRALVEGETPGNSTHGYSPLVRRALADGRLEALDAIAKCIMALKCSSVERDFFRLALLGIIPRFSSAVANGGWLRWRDCGNTAENIEEAFGERVEMMVSDISRVEKRNAQHWHACVADARALPSADGSYSAVISSPPYPNRHDYTRIFGVELMFGFHGWRENRALRYQMFHSHPEARPVRPTAANYRRPERLQKSIEHVEDMRLRRMLDGYFLDMYLCLREVNRVCKKGGNVAFVVGNAQYKGKPLLVDEFTAEIGEQVGLECNEIRAIRWRGNSAQQMGRYGRNAARESIVMFRKRGESPGALDSQAAREEKRCFERNQNGRR